MIKIKEKNIRDLSEKCARSEVAALQTDRYSNKIKDQENTISNLEASLKELQNQLSDERREKEKLLNIRSDTLKKVEEEKNSLRNSISR